MTGARNVTPGYDPGRDTDSPPEWLGWSWPSRGRNFAWLGVLLVMVGAGLLIQYLVPGVSATTLVLAALSLAFLAGSMFGGSYFALVPGLLIGALVVARLIDELNVYRGGGTTALALAAAFLFIWLIGVARRRQRSDWPLWGVAIFGLIGVVQVAGRVGTIPELGALWPAVIIVVGLFFLLNARRRSEPRPRE